MNKIIGYQWGDKNQFIGEYEIAAYDKEANHMPHNTTFVEPPAQPEGKEAAWNGTSWVLRNKWVPPELPQPPMNIAKPVA